jgi:hypothetical protein
MGRITPNWEWSESHRPHAEWTVAGWLPVQRYETEIEAWFTVSAGKVVAEDTEGHLVPAGLKKTFNVATGTTVLTYTANDVAANVIDLTTGVAVAGATSYTEAQLTVALRERGLIRHTQRATDFISKPVGIATYNYYKAPGSDHYNPANLYQHNFRPQALVAITCDYVGTYPVLPALATTEATANRMGGAAGLMEDIFDGTTAREAAATGFFSSTQIAQVTRYASQVTAGDDVVCFLTINYPVAHITEDSPITTSTDACLVREVDSIARISAAGDYYIDYEVGAIFLYEAGGNAVPSPWVAATTTITYYHYQAEGTATNTVSTYACATGNLEYGDFLTYDANSNLVKATLDISAAEGYSSASAGTLYSTDPDYDDPGTDAAISAQIEAAIDGHLFGIVGQIIGVNTFGEGQYSRAYLDRVATAYQGYSAANMQTPGSATGGRTDQLTYANGAERMILVNLIMR